MAGKVQVDASLYRHEAPIARQPLVCQSAIVMIKACISGAAPLPVEVQEAFEKLSHGRLAAGYGLSEVSPGTDASPLHDLHKVGSIGLPLPSAGAGSLAWRWAGKRRPGSLANWRYTGHR